ncbi:MAG: hypothetical protein K8S22_16290 [Betaproteobacteria bacterium]|nr:hypothetical protein [Betaproteobacteria bacterium]
MSIVDKDAAGESPTAESTPGGAAAPVADPSKEKSTAVGNVIVLAIFATAFASGFWLPTKFDVSHLAAGFIGFGVAVFIAISGFLAYLGIWAWLARKRARREIGLVPAKDDPAFQKAMAEFDADVKALGIDREIEALATRTARQTRAMDDLRVSADFKSMSREQQEVRLKKFVDEWMAHSKAEIELQSESTARRIVELRDRREREARTNVQREADIERLHDMERRAQAGGYTDEPLLAEIQALQLRLNAAKHSGPGDI